MLLRDQRPNKRQPTQLNEDASIPITFCCHQASELPTMLLDGVGLVHFRLKLPASEI